MHARRLGRGMGHNQFDPNYHLSRAVQCVDCHARLHKTHHFVLFGYRCASCYQAAVARGETPEKGR